MSEHHHIPLTYEQFGRDFIHRAITPARVRRELLKLLAEPIEGSISRLPAELLTARYVFRLQDVHVETRPDALPELGLRQRLVGTLALTVKLLGLPLRFTLQIGIRLEQRVRTYAPLTVRIETQPIDPAAVDIAVDAHNMPGEVLDRLNLIEGAVRAEVVEEVNRRLRSGAIAAATNIDLLHLTERAALSMAPQPAPRAEPPAGGEPAASTEIETAPPPAFKPLPS